MSCPLTPARGSYFCEGHINHTTMFNFKVSKSTEILMDVKMIKEKKKPTSFDTFKIYDCFVNTDDKLLYLLADTNQNYFITLPPTISSPNKAI